MNHNDDDEIFTLSHVNNVHRCQRRREKHILIKYDVLRAHKSVRH